MIVPKDNILDVKHFDLFDVKKINNMEIRNGRITIFNSIHLNGSLVTLLPDNLSVRGTMDISNTDITKLPRGLEIFANFYVTSTKICWLPRDLVVYGTLYVDRDVYIPDTVHYGELYRW